MPTRDPSHARFSNELLSTEFNSELEIAPPHLSSLIREVPFDDEQGVTQKFVVTGNVAEPRELHGDAEHFDEIGEYVFEIAPKSYGGGIKAHDDDLRDSRIPVVMDAVRQQGAKARYFLEKTLVADVIESATAVDGFDGEPLFSATHNWDTGDDAALSEVAATYTTDQSNIYAAGRSSDYSATSQVYEDFFGAMAQMNGFVDDKGTKLNSGEGQAVILFNNQSASLWRFLRLAFVEQSLPGEDTNREGLSLGVTLVPTPHLTSTGGSTDQDWYIFLTGAGNAKPLVHQKRQDVETQTWRDPKRYMNYWDYKMRFGVSWNAWWSCIKVNNS